MGYLFTPLVGVQRMFQVLLIYFNSITIIPRMWLKKKKGKFGFKQSNKLREND
ncbi:hypothetical protein J3R82DRAFT_9423 [Butyriboletus roseoflavus]|nr:hypothetical protein J3R82DRAFT_9423 [Butyriboletus roseoflavus]